MSTVTHSGKLLLNFGNLKPISGFQSRRPVEERLLPEAWRTDNYFDAPMVPSKYWKSGQEIPDVFPWRHTDMLPDEMSVYRVDIPPHEKCAVGTNLNP